MDAPGITHQDWLGRAAALKPPDRLIMGGRLAPAGTGATAPVRSPRDGACLAEVGDGAAADIDAAVCYEEGDMTVPFGDYQQSGNGRDKSAHALEKYTELKTTRIAL